LALVEFGRRLGPPIRRGADSESKKESCIDTFISHIGIALEILTVSDKEEGRVTVLRDVLECSGEKIA
jgi:hypothetical protein